MRTRAFRGVVIGSLAALLACVLPSARAAAAPAGGDPYQRVSLALAQDLVAMFPAAQGFVVSVDAGEAYVDLAEKDLMRPGLELQIFRPGAEMVHPVTKQVLGTYETDLGDLRLTEVREKYSRGKVEAAAGATVVAGDRVRVSARRLRALLAIAGSAPGVETTPLVLALLGRGAESGRFTMVDEPVWAPSLAPLGATPQAVAADPASLRRLGEAAGADLLLLTTVEPGPRPIVTVDVRSLRTGASLGVVRAPWPQPGEPVTTAAPRPAPMAPAAPAVPAPAAFDETSGTEPRPAAPAAAPPVEEEYVSRDLPGGGVALAAGDVLGEGRTEVLISDGNRLALYRWEAQKLVWLWDEEWRGGRKVVSLDAMDLDGDARAEVLVSVITWGRVATEIRSWRGGKLETIGTADGLYLRAAPRPGGTTLLLGQRAGIDDALTGPVEEYRWRAGAVERVDGTALPRGAGIFGLAFAPEGGAAARFALERTGYLYAYDAGGKALWRSAQTYGGYPAPLKEEDLGGGSALTGPAFDEAMLAFQGRLFAEPAGGGMRVLVPQNYSDLPIVMTRMRKFGKGEIVLLEGPPGAVSLEETGRSRSFDGYIADMARADVDGDGRAETLFLVNRHAGVLLGERGKLVAWRPPPPSAAPRN